MCMLPYSSWLLQLPTDILVHTRLVSSNMLSVHGVGSGGVLCIDGAVCVCGDCGLLDK